MLLFFKQDSKTEHNSLLHTYIYDDSKLTVDSAEFRNTSL